MEDLKKSIFKDKEVQLEDTVPWEESNNLPSVPTKSARKEEKKQEVTSQDIDTDFLQKWEKIVSLAEEQKYQQSVKNLIEMDDDIYFLRYMLKYSQDNVLDKLTRHTSNKLLKKML